MVSLLKSNHLPTHIFTGTKQNSKLWLSIPSLWTFKDLSKPAFHPVSQARCSTRVSSLLNLGHDNQNSLFSSLDSCQAFFTYSASFHALILPSRRLRIFALCFLPILTTGKTVLHLLCTLDSLWTASVYVRCICQMYCATKILFPHGKKKKKSRRRYLHICKMLFDCFF